MVVFHIFLLLSNHILLIRISHNKFFRKKSPKEKQLYVKYVCYLKYLCIHCLYFLWNVLRQNKCSLCRNLHVSWGQSILKSRFELKGISALSSKKLKSCPPKISNPPVLSIDYDRSKEFRRLPPLVNEGVVWKVPQVK